MPRAPAEPSLSPSMTVHFGVSLLVSRLLLMLFRLPQRFIMADVIISKNMEWVRN